MPRHKPKLPQPNTVEHDDLLKHTAPANKGQADNFQPERKRANKLK
jgi:hypothetical protein